MHSYLGKVTHCEGKVLVWILGGLLLVMAILAVIFYWEPPQTTGQKILAGQIESIDGPVSSYVLEQQGKPVQVGFLVPVYVGDKIEIKKPNHILELFLGGHQRVRVTYKDSPYIVKNVGEVPTLQTNIVQAGINLTGEHESKCNPETICDPVDAGIRGQTHGDDLLMPLLEDNPSQMVAGKRSLYLRWFGGESPYQVTISENGQLLTSKSVNDQWIKTQALSFEISKTYQITIQDAKEQNLTETFEGIATIDFPKELRDSGLSPESRQTVWAMELASQEQGLWMLEAYQQASEIAEKHYPARLVRDRLEKGLRVVKPQ